MNKFLRLIITLVVIALVGFGIYYFWIAGRAADTSTGIAPAGFSSASGLPNELQSLAQANDEFLRQLDSLKEVSLRSDIFSSAIFNERLIDSSFQLDTEPRCRRNPFAAIGVESEPCVDGSAATILPLEFATSTATSTNGS